MDPQKKIVIKQVSNLFSLFIEKYKIYIRYTIYIYFNKPDT